MKVVQLATGLGYWSSLWKGRSVTVKGTLKESWPFDLRYYPFNGFPMDNNSRASIEVHLNWSVYGDFEGRTRRSCYGDIDEG